MTIWLRAKWCAVLKMRVKNRRKKKTVTNFRKKKCRFHQIDLPAHTNFLFSAAITPSFSLLFINILIEVIIEEYVCRAKRFDSQQNTTTIDPMYCVADVHKISVL